jgi:hypothetical protein
MKVNLSKMNFLTSNFILMYFYFLNVIFCYPKC